MVRVGALCLAHDVTLRPGHDRQPEIEQQRVLDPGAGLQNGEFQVVWAGFTWISEILDRILQIIEIRGVENS